MMSYDHFSYQNGQNLEIAGVSPILNQRLDKLLWLIERKQPTRIEIFQLRVDWKMSINGWKHHKVSSVIQSWSLTSCHEGTRKQAFNPASVTFGQIPPSPLEFVASMGSTSKALDQTPTSRIVGQACPSNLNSRNIRVCFRKVIWDIV